MESGDGLSSFRSQSIIKGMSINWPKPHFNNTSEFQVSAWPFITSSTTVSNQAINIRFPSVTQWVQIKNTDGSKNLRFGFTQNGVNNGNYQVLETGKTIAAQTPVLTIKCAEIWFRGDTFTDAVNFSVIAGLTNVPAGDFPTITGSSGYDGVG